MNKDFNKWTEDVKRQRAPESIHNQIDNLTSRNKFTLYFKRTAIVFGLVLSMLVVAVNVSDKFYTFAQDNPILKYISYTRFLDSTAKHAIGTEKYQRINKPLKVLGGEINLEYLIIEGDSIMVLFSSDTKTNYSEAFEPFDIEMTSASAWSTSTVKVESLDMWMYRITYYNIKENGGITLPKTIELKGQEETIEIEVDTSKKLDTQVVELNKRIDLDENSSIIIDQIEIAEFSTTVKVLDSPDTYFNHLLLSVTDSKNVEYGTRGYTGVNNYFTFEFGIGRQNMKDTTDLTIHTVTWNDKNTEKGTMNFDTGDFKNLNPKLKFIGFTDNKGVKLEALNKDIEDKTNVSNPISFRSGEESAYYPITIGETSSYVVIDPKLKPKGTVEFYNNWGSFRADPNLKITIDVE